MKVAKITLITIMVGLILAGCCGPKQAKIEEAPLLPCSAPRMVSSEQQFPGGQVINLTKLAPSQVVLNEPFKYSLKVENLTDRELLNVVVTDAKPAHMKINRSDPEFEEVEGELRWELGSLAANDYKIIAINAVALETGAIVTCAEVTYDTPTCAQIDIVRSKLKLVKKVPSESLKCNRIPISYTITNEGDAYACDISIEDELPGGMLTSEGDDRVSFSIDNLGPGESREFKTVVDAMEVGAYASSAVAIARSGGKITSNIPETIVTQPVLMISETCPASQRIGRSLTYEIMVSNKGDGIAEGAVVVASIPDHTQFKSSSGGGVYTHSSPGQVTWEIGDMQPNSSKIVTMKLTLDEPGTLVTTATAKAFCAEPVSDSCRTELSGIPAILLEVVDVSDPIEVGEVETYVITVTNQGTAVDNDIVIIGFLEDNMEYISASGPTEASFSDGKVSFAPLEMLEPKGRATWRVNIKATGEGDIRFKTTMNSAQLGRDVVETEATRFYK